MGKKQLHFPEAERLFVVEGCTLQDIESTIGVSSRTLQDWKVEGGWEQKRIAMRKMSDDSGSTATSIAHKILLRIHKKIEEDTELSPTEILFVKEFMPSRSKIKTAEETAAETTPVKTSAGLSNEAISKFNELLGR